MPQATAVWLIQETSLTFEQIAKFCDLDLFEVQAIADGDTAQANIIGMNPITNNQLTQEEIERCEKDPKASLKMDEQGLRYAQIQGAKKDKKKYVPLARRGDKPEAILWVLRQLPEMSDTQICKLLGTTKNLIESIRSRTHRNFNTLKPRDPVMLDLCTQKEIDQEYEKAKNLALQLTNDKKNSKMQQAKDADISL